MSVRPRYNEAVVPLRLYGRPLSPEKLLQRLDIRVCQRAESTRTLDVPLRQCLLRAREVGVHRLHAADYVAPHAQPLSRLLLLQHGDALGNGTGSIDELIDLGFHFIERRGGR